MACANSDHETEVNQADESHTGNVTERRRQGASDNVVLKTMKLLNALKLKKRKRKTEHSSGNQLSKEHPSDFVQPSTFTEYKSTVSSYFYLYGRHTNWMTICPIPVKKAWVFDIWDGNGETILTLITKWGKEKETIKVADNVFNLSIHPITGHMFVILDNNSIGIIEEKGDRSQVRVLFQLEDHTSLITVTCDDYIICLKTSKVSKYKQDGTVVATADKDYMAFDISVCGMTNNVAVSCAHRGVAILDAYLRELFTYEFEGQTGDVLKAYTAVFDNKGNILVCEFIKGAIHVVGGNSGRCLQVINIKHISNVYNIRFFRNMLWIRCIYPQSIICVKLF